MKNLFYRHNSEPELFRSLGRGFQFSHISLSYLMNNERDLFYLCQSAAEETNYFLPSRFPQSGQAVGRLRQTLLFLWPAEDPRQTNCKS